MKDVRKDIKHLSDELKYMYAFLEKMSAEENPDDQDKIWMTDVREMSYDIEDSLDDFMICIDDDKSVKKKSLMKKCTRLVDKMKAHGRISKAIQEFKTQIREVGDRNHRYRTGVTTTKDTHEMIDIRAQAIFKDASDLVGIDEQKNELINLLTDDGSSSHHQVKVVAIVGLGGLGKTTLANQVYESLKDKFDCKAFVTVSRTPHMMEVLRTILRDISEQEYTGDMQHLIKKISNFLQDKRYARKQLIR
jgi:disease resistance protein RPM1